MELWNRHESPDPKCVTSWIWVTGSRSLRVEMKLQMAGYVKALCSLKLTTAAGSPLGKTGNDSTSRLPVQTGNRDVSWQYLPPSFPLRLSDKRLSFPVLVPLWCWGAKEGWTVAFWKGNKKLGIHKWHWFRDWFASLVNPRNSQESAPPHPARIIPLCNQLDCVL